MDKSGKAARSSYSRNAERLPLGLLPMAVIFVYVRSTVEGGVTTEQTLLAPDSLCELQQMQCRVAPLGTQHAPLVLTYGRTSSFSADRFSEGC
jgi:hypothetical protein